MRKIFCFVVSVAILLFSISVDAKVVFENDSIDESYNFSKLNRIFIADTDISAIEALNANESYYIPYFESVNKNAAKKMDCELVTKDLTDALIEITVEEWKSVFDHREPEKIVYEGYKTIENNEYYYEGYVEESENRWYTDPKTGKRVNNPQKVRRYKRSNYYFFGANKVIKPHYTKRKITSSTPFSGSKAVVYSSSDVYRTDVKILFKIRDVKTGNVIMSREGFGNVFYKNKQLDIYIEICEAFFKDYKNFVKRMQKK